MPDKATHSTTPFDGFRDKQRYYSLPAEFFSHVVPQIDNLAELKLTLFCFWAIWQAEGDFRYLTYNSLAINTELRHSLQTADPAADFHTLLDDALARAVQRKTLLEARITPPSGPVTLYILNTEKGRLNAEQLAAGHYQEVTIHDIELLPDRPNIFRLFEREIGQTITHMLAEDLKDAEQEFPHEWIVDAIKEAVAHNKRNWRYVRAILDNWQQKGRYHDEKTGQNSESEWDYEPGAYDDFIKS